ncbi:olfactory receptor 14A2-like [Tachyglossus aculeatus]|uniref:olfactory receptor 14A2-like n=1 Tax=Tachyglossus aculeatus TaxID=9261 RepID=UPI0018F7782F|nr:olfactory receptor 14A2-like [Tachyglossus aculeatus]
MPNIPTVREFLLLGFSEVRELQLVHAALFLLVYLAALTGNLLIVAATTLDRRLHTPMYFFLGHLCVLDLCYISVTVPKSIYNSLTERRSISFLGCAAQLFSVVLFGGSEMFLLTVMSYDRYATICLPLRYEVIMNGQACGMMAAASWLTGGLLTVMCSAGMFSLSFCGSNIVLQFFCDIPSVLKLSCSKDHVAIDVSITTGVSLGIACFILIIVSYVRIFWAVLRMPASEGRAKAFSTCVPHLIVVTVFISTALFTHLKPPSDSFSIMDLLVSVFYSVVPPVLNPLIYSLRNRDMKAAMGRILIFLVVMFGSSEMFLLTISCSEDHIVIYVTFTCGVAAVLVCFISIIVSYISCSEDHVVSDVSITGGPVSDSPSTLDLLLSISYTVMPPALNPLIYSLRNRDMKTALKRVSRPWWQPDKELPKEEVWHLRICHCLGRKLINRV